MVSAIRFARDSNHYFKSKTHADSLRRYALLNYYIKSRSLMETFRAPKVFPDEGSKIHRRNPVTVIPMPQFHYDIQPPTVSYYIDTLETIGVHQMIRLEDFTVRNIQDAHEEYVFAVRLALSNSKDDKVDSTLVEQAAQALFVLYRMYVHFFICNPSESWLATTAKNKGIEPTRLEMWQLDKSPWLKRFVKARKLETQMFLPDRIRERDRAPMWWRKSMFALINALDDDRDAYEIVV